VVPIVFSSPTREWLRSAKERIESRNNENPIDGLNEKELNLKPENSTKIYSFSVKRAQRLDLTVGSVRNVFPLALNGYPGCSLHFLKSLGLFFSCSNADSITSCLGMYG